MPSPSVSTSTCSSAGTIGVGRRSYWVMANCMESPTVRTPTWARSMTASFEPGEPGCPGWGDGSRGLVPVSEKASTTPSATDMLRRVSGAVPSAPSVTLLDAVTTAAAFFGSACQPNVAFVWPPDVTLR